MIVLEDPVLGLQPALKWAGGKRWLVPEIAKFWRRTAKNCRLVEPFAGAIAISLGLAPRDALLNDSNQHLINFHRWVQQGLTIPDECLPENTQEAYYALRCRFNELIQSGQTEGVEAARLFYLLNRTGYNGLSRFNRAGLFNVPPGRYARPCFQANFASYQLLTKNWRFETGDFSLLELQPTDFVYADPPYDAGFTQYGSSTFTWNDQVRLVEWAIAHPGPMMISNKATDRIKRLYRKAGFRLKILEGPRRISCSGNRKPEKEVLAYRNC